MSTETNESFSTDTAVDSTLSAADSLLEGMAACGMVTFKEYTERVGTAVEWLWEPYIGLGMLTVVAAAAKVGKSTAIGYLLKPMLTGKTFWGGTTRGPPAILLFTEEGPELTSRFDELGLSELVATSPLFIHEGHPTWLTIIDILDLVAPEGSLVILDTGSRFWGVEDENNAGHVNQALEPLLEVMKRRRLALVFVHHTNKGTATTGGRGDVMDMVRGSGALSGSAAVILVMQKVKGDGSGTKRKLALGGRLGRGGGLGSFSVGHIAR